jgi:UDPglucose--hexose-1-phosphate uridylyltransferase
MAERTPEARFDPLSDKAVLVAPRRMERPTHSKECPICCGDTPPATYVYPPGAPQWQVEVVPNRYSCFTAEGANVRFETVGGLNGIVDPAGWCEVLFETEHHKHPIYARSPEELVHCLRALVDRYRFARNNPRVKLFYAFKNFGRPAGGTLEHEHWQIYVLSFVPPSIEVRYARAAAYFNRTGRSLYRDVFSSEATLGERVVSVSRHFLTFAPFAAGMPYEIWIAPLRDSSDFTAMTEEEMADFACALRDAMARLCANRPDLPFNIALQTAAFEHDRCPWFCWHLSIFPRLTALAGVELGINVMVNPVPPEDAAAALRAVPLA